MQVMFFGMGCFWGAERKFWQTEGVVSTSVGYMGGSKNSPTYEQVCSGKSGHAEVVRVVYDPTRAGILDMLHVFWGNHDPTQLNRQGNDRGTQYRSCIFYSNDEQKAAVDATMAKFNGRLAEAGKGQIVTKVEPAADHAYYYAEDYHQQYLAKNVNGYCGLGGTGCYRPSDVNDLAQ
eukprot:TRINITY_DN13862_c0_g1_i1.p1 TRINITY_DN13862_c0_g1~~TRINITY_DN13862_c0_g1_i1.p1  ORF type:complete len:205 (-),score=21.44 TRINITY_DN13862_c0_g1_i1:75-605(-)